MCNGLRCGCGGAAHQGDEVGIQGTTTAAVAATKTIGSLPKPLTDLTKLSIRQVTRGYHAYKTFALFGCDSHTAQQVYSRPWRQFSSLAC